MSPVARRRSGYLCLSAMGILLILSLRVPKELKNLNHPWPSLKGDSVTNSSSIRCSDSDEQQILSEPPLRRQRGPPTSNCLVIFHIPKSGGTSLREFVTSLTTVLAAETDNEHGGNGTWIPWLEQEWYTYFDEHHGLRRGRSETIEAFLDQNGRRNKQPQTKRGSKAFPDPKPVPLTEDLPPPLAADVLLRLEATKETKLLLKKYPNAYNFTSHMVHIGHMTPHFLNVTQTDTCKLMTLLREPFDRVLSAFYFHKHNDPEWDSCLFSSAFSPQPQPQSPLSHSNVSNPAVLSKQQQKVCEHGHQYHNDMVRLLSSGDNHHTWDTYDYARYVQYTHLEEEDDPHGEKAIRRAQQFLLDLDLVCFLDALDECQEGVQRLLGLEEPTAFNSTENSNQTWTHQRKKSLPRIGQLNANAKRPNNTILQNRSMAYTSRNQPIIETDILLGKLRAMNALDIDLYDWAVRQFHPI